MKIQAIGKNILIKRTPPQTHKGGLLLPTQEVKNEGVVISVGYEVNELDSRKIFIDDIILFSPYSGTPIKLEDEEYLVINYDHVLGVIYDE